MRQADKLKKAGCILLVTTMIAALTGCSQKAPEPEAAPQQEAANAPAEDISASPASIVISCTSSVTAWISRV